jgi:hypothetical protein
MPSACMVDAYCGWHLVNDETKSPTLNGKKQEPYMQLGAWRSCTVGLLAMVRRAHQERLPQRCRAFLHLLAAYQLAVLAVLAVLAALAAVAVLAVLAATPHIKRRS